MSWKEYSTFENFTGTWDIVVRHDQQEVDIYHYELPEGEQPKESITCSFEEFQELVDLLKKYSQ